MKKKKSIILRGYSPGRKKTHERRRLGKGDKWRIFPGEFQVIEKGCLNPETACLRKRSVDGGIHRLIGKKDHKKGVGEKTGTAVSGVQKKKKM